MDYYKFLIISRNIEEKIKFREINDKNLIIV